MQFTQRRQVIRQLVLIFDGAFLLLAGSLQMAMEFAAHFWHTGPYATVFGSSPYTIGFVEAHGLATLISLLLVRAAFGEHNAFWHGFAGVVHLLLGGANLLFWDSFAAFGLVNTGKAATLLHLLFIVAQSICYVSFRDRSGQTSYA